MNKIMGVGIVLLFVVACVQPIKVMKINYQVLKDKDHKMLVGVVNRKLIATDTAFAWFNDNLKYGQPDATAVDIFKKEKNNFSLIVFGGTWCEDTQNLLPKLYQLIDASGYPEKQISLLAVDRKKQTINNLNIRYNITNVPTFIVLKQGKEVGRVTEYGTKGDITKELGEIVVAKK